jgi:uncharacterized UBP type Zn finger protein
MHAFFPLLPHPATVPAGRDTTQPCTGRHTGDVSCTHLDEIHVTSVPAEIAGCEECLKTGGWWVHLRMCQSCGKIGCCDNSPNKHATAHFHETSHPIIRSAEPGEDWSWCYVDEIGFELG